MNQSSQRLHEKIGFGLALGSWATAFGRVSLEQFVVLGGCLVVALPVSMLGLRATFAPFCQFWFADPYE